MSKTKQRALVTGGAGFLGSHLCDRLLHEGYAEVVCLDNFYTGTEQNIAHLRADARWRVVKHDVTQPFADDFFAEPFTEIFNLACPASPPHYQHNPIHTMKTNVLGMINVLDVATRMGAKVLQASTSEIYGDPLEHPQTESYRGNVNTIGPRACYDEGKRSAETLCFDYQRQKNANIRVARIFNTYGPRMLPNDGRVVSNFVVQALRGEALTMYGDGKQTRAFCYVDDLVDGLVRLMHAPDDVNGPVNLGNPNEFTVHQLAEQILAMTGSASHIEYRPLPQDDPRQRQPDISLALSALNWRPKVSLQSGLERTIAYFRQALKDSSKGNPSR